MGIFDRIGRMARAEVSELKRVLRDADQARLDPDEQQYQRDIAAAEAELARDSDFDALAAEIDGGASAWGAPSDDIERGADLWARGGAEAPEPKPAHRDARVGAFTREVREAYATLELPLGADRAAIDEAYRAMLQRYHPDRHAQSPHLLKAATELTIRIREARELLVTWLG